MIIKIPFIQVLFYPGRTWRLQIPIVSCVHLSTNQINNSGISTARGTEITSTPYVMALPGELGRPVRLLLECRSLLPPSSPPASPRAPPASSESSPCRKARLLPALLYCFLPPPDHQPRRELVRPRPHAHAARLLPPSCTRHPLPIRQPRRHPIRPRLHGGRGGLLHPPAARRRSPWLPSKGGGGRPAGLVPLVASDERWSCAEGGGEFERRELAE